MTTFIRLVIVGGALGLATPGMAQAPCPGAAVELDHTALAAGILFGPLRLPRRVLANGVMLAPGCYVVRITGHTSEQDRWVEFVSDGRVAGRELATVIPAAELASVAGGQPPRSGDVRVQTLQGGDYVRVWVNAGGSHVLIHLPVA